jgi:hypothetical protein
MPHSAKMGDAVAHARRLIEQHQWRDTNQIDEDWWGEAACRGMNRQIFFAPEEKITHTYYEEAYEVCRVCPVAAECLAEAILEERGQAQSNIFGVRGGLIPRERVAIAIRLNLRKGDQELQTA